MSAVLIGAALATDTLLGEPRRAHPLVAFGRYAQRLEKHLHPGASAATALTRWRGLIAWLLAVVPLSLLCALLMSATSRWPLLQALLQVLLLYLVIGHRSLREHAHAVWLALRAGGLDAARQRVGYMVSRDTRQMDERSVAAATVESVLENGSDAVFAAVFWFALAGAPAALAYRLANTLDAMWGYRSPRYRDFGYAAAKLDDALNWLPARLTAVSYALAGRTLRALHCWREQAPHWDSPNGGPVMAAGAGALGIRLGGAATYQGIIKQRPPLGEGRIAEAQDIGRAQSLLLRALIIWLAALLMMDVLIAHYWSHHA